MKKFALILVCAALSACAAETPSLAQKSDTCEKVPVIGETEPDGSQKYVCALPARDPFAKAQSNAANQPQRDVRAAIDKLNP